MTIRAVTAAQRRLYESGLPVSAFGKLPCYKDFVRVDAGTAGVRAFADWIDRGFGLRWDDLEGGGERVADRTRVLAVFREAGAAVVGVIEDSSDEGGLRRFPFALFTEIPLRALDIGSPAFYVGLVPVWRVLEVLLSQAIAMTSISEFYDACRGRMLAPEVPDDADPFPAAALPADRLAGGSVAPNGPSLAALLFALGRTIRIQKKDEPRGRMTLAYRLPCVPEPDAATQAGVWASLLLRSFSRLSAPATAFLPRVGAGGLAALALLFRPLEPADVRLLSPRAAGAQRVFDLAGERLGRDSIPARYAAVLERDLLGHGPDLARLAAYKLPRVKRREMAVGDGG